jgi:hypothetical protein
MPEQDPQENDLIKWYYEDQRGFYWEVRVKEKEGWSESPHLHEVEYRAIKI